MKTLLLVCAMAATFISCTKENLKAPDGLQENQNNATAKFFTNEEPVDNAPITSGSSQFSGVGYYAVEGECNLKNDGVAYSVRMTGALQGCLDVYVDSYDCSPSGTYRESGREYFTGTYKGNAGTFWTAYRFESKFEGCSATGAPLGSEIFGRCQHPIVAGSGTGAFTGVTGRISFKDDVTAGDFPFIGHLRF